MSSGPTLAGLNRLTLEQAPEVCRGCVWWQSRSGKRADKRRWTEKAEAEWGAWGTVYFDSDGRLLGSMQYGPAHLFPRAADLPGGPPSADAVLVTCAYLTDSSSPWVMQSLFLAAIGDARDKGAKALETFAYRYAEHESPYERFQVHKTIFPADFLADFGFVPVRRAGRVELVRLEFGGLIPVTAGTRRRLVRAVKGALAPAPVPAPPA